MNARETVKARLPETYQWLLTPVQKNPSSVMDWEASRLTGQDGLAVRAARRLKSDDLLATKLAGSVLAMTIDQIPLWRGDDVKVNQLIDDFAQYVYLRRLQEPQVLLDAVKDGANRLLWRDETFAYAEALDESSGEYRGLQAGSVKDVLTDGFLVKPDIAGAQVDARAKGTDERETPAGTGNGQSETSGADTENGGDEETETPPPRPKRFHGSIDLDPARAARDAGQVADEVISHLAAIGDAEVTVTLEIEAKVPSGAPDDLVRTVTENSRTLRFKTHGFEPE